MDGGLVRVRVHVVRAVCVWVGERENARNINAKDNAQIREIIPTTLIHGCVNMTNFATECRYCAKWRITCSNVNLAELPLFVIRSVRRF